MKQTVIVTCDQCGASHTLTIEEVDYAKMKRKMHPRTAGWVQQHFLCGKNPGDARMQVEAVEVGR